MLNDFAFSNGMGIFHSHYPIHQSRNEEIPIHFVSKKFQKISTPKSSENALVSGSKGNIVRQIGTIVIVSTYQNIRGRNRNDPDES
jgi:hypothetical protein